MFQQFKNYVKSELQINIDIVVWISIIIESINLRINLLNFL